MQKMQQEERLRKALERAQADTKRPVSETHDNTKHNTLNVGDRQHTKCWSQTLQKKASYMTSLTRCQCIDISTQTLI